MRKRFFVRLVLTALYGLMLTGCEAEPQTVLLNSVDKYFSDEAMLEATARELTVDGDEASVRLSIMNLSGEQIDGFGVSVAFLDSTGAVLYTSEQRVQFETPLENYESASVTAVCSGKNVKKIAAVSISNAAG